MTDEAMFEVFGARQRELQAEAEERWGDTDAYRESRRRTRDNTRQDWGLSGNRTTDGPDACREASRSPRSVSAATATSSHGTQGQLTPCLTFRDTVVA
jgi:hypothetical protein